MSGKGVELLNEVLASGEAPEGGQAASLVHSLVKCILGEQRWTERVCSQSLAMCVWTLLADAARENWTVHQLKERMNSEHPLCAAIAEAFEKDGPMLRSELETIGWDYPELVDVEWSVRNVVETELLSRVSEPFVSFKLHVLPAGETKTRPIEFHCDINQFQDLHSKFKEAMNVVEQLKKD